MKVGGWKGGGVLSSVVRINPASQWGELGQQQQQQHQSHMSHLGCRPKLKYAQSDKCISALAS